MTEQRMRASDAERERVAEVLRAAMADGRLSLAEGEERLAAAYAASYRDELAGLTTDLPTPPGEGDKPAGTPTDRPADRPADRPSGRSHRRFRPAVGVLFGLALLATGWALWLGGPAWPAIVLFIVAASVTKHHLLHRNFGQQAPGRCWSDASSRASG